MRLAVATDDGVMVTGHVGRCNAFVIYTIENKSIINTEVRENNFTHHKQQAQKDEHHRGEGHSHGHGHSNLINALSDCEALIFTSGGWRLVEELKTNNIKPILTDEPLAELAALKYSKGELESREDNVCNHH
jgi:predicted Fe-Mo cluster-binding NifX family protein